jgi:hypothetical protein
VILPPLVFPVPTVIHIFRVFCSFVSKSLKTVITYTRDAISKVTSKEGKCPNF